MTGLFYAHSGLRYLVLLAGVVALAYFLYGLAAGRPAGKGARVLMAVFVGMLDLQILLGLVLVAAGIFYPALTGHLVMMLLAAVVAHGASVLARGAEGSRAWSLRLVGVAAALALVVGGVLAIGRSLLGTGAPSMLP